MHQISSTTILLLIFVAFSCAFAAQSSTLLRHYIFGDSTLPPALFCPQEVTNMKNTIYLLYDVNYPEGFNLRRDVYIRLAVFVRHLQSRIPFANVRLVLPPWRRLYHWKSSHIQQENLPWSSFFDIESLRRFAPVLDFHEFLQEANKFGFQESPYIPVHQTFQLLQFKEMFDNGVFHDKFEFVTSSSDCRKENYLHGSLLQQSLLLDNDFHCVRFQGSVNLLEKMLRRVLKNIQKNTESPNDDPKVFTILNAEIVLHENWGDREFWRARRSMRFAKNLVAIAEKFRRVHFNSINGWDLVQRPPMWEFEQKYRNAIGGNYLCAHLRRGDFIHGRESTTPTLKSTAAQIKQALQSLNLTSVFIATDATAFEFKNLKAYLQRAHIVRFGTESLEQKASIKDGGIAIVDQLICSHARYFIGTYESTFTYRIYEEREILGFPKTSTFNTFCKSETLQNCSKNTVWPIVY